MSTIATSRTRSAERVPHWSSTDHAGARPYRGPALHATPRAAPKRIVSGAQSKPIGQTSSHNRFIPTPRHLSPTHIVAIKSP